jgi:chromosome partitioning protein
LKVLSFFNHAGGVAKTSTIRDLGYVLADSGYRVLLLDLDPQANLTKWLGVEDAIPLARTIYPAIVDRKSEPDGEPEERKLPQPYQVHGMDLIPSTLNLATLERELLSQFMGIVRLREAIRKLDSYDFVLIDPPPSLGQLSALAVVAADSVIVPVPTNRKGLDGIPTVISMVREYRSAAPNLSIALFVLTQHDQRTRHDRDSLDVIREQLPAVAPISTPLSSRPAIYSDTLVRGEPIPVFAPGSKADLEIRAVAGELLQATGAAQ